MKKSLSLVAIIAAFAMIFGLGPAGHVAAASQVTLLSSNESTNNVAVGQPNNFQATIGGASTDQTVLVDMELKDSSGNKVGQTFYDNWTIPANTSHTFWFTTQNIQQAGSYSFSVGIFNPGWNGLQNWYEGVQSFTVSGTAPPPHETGVVPETCCFSTTPFNVTAGQQVTVVEKFQNQDNVSHTVLIDIEMHNNTTDQKLQQVFYDNQTFAPGEEKTYTWNVDTTGLSPGQYRIPVGIFNPGWNGLIAWYAGLGGFQVNQ